MSEQLKTMKKTLMAAAQSQIGNLEQVDAKELGEVIDMIKDLTEAEYYCSIVKAMEESKESRENQDKIDMAVAKIQNEVPNTYYTPYMYSPSPVYGDNRYDRTRERMYYDGRSVGNGNNPTGINGSSNGSNSMSFTVRDYREGRSPKWRKGYMESKELHKDNATKTQELNTYMEELSHDIMEMMEGASPEEKTLLRDKLSNLTQKIV